MNRGMTNQQTPTWEEFKSPSRTRMKWRLAWDFISRVGGRFRRKC